MKSVFASIDQLAVIVNLCRKNAEKSTSNIKDGSKVQFQILQKRIRKIRSFSEDNAKKRIGVFGARKRGKSTLLNALIGEGLLPTSPIPMSTTTVEIEQEKDATGWNLIVDHMAGGIERRECSSPNEIAELLEVFGSKRGGGPPAKRLRVTGAFPECRIFQRGGILIDTPGAEIVFDEQSEDIAEESSQAIQALEHTHLVLFCIRADQVGSQSDSEFYATHVRTLAPLHVVTMKDKWHDEPRALINTVLEQYGLAYGKPCLVEAKTAPTSKEANMESGVPNLEERILQELDMLSPESGLLPCLKEFALALEEHESLLPERIHFLALREAISRSDIPEREECLELLLNEPLFRKFW